MSESQVECYRDWKMCVDGQAHLLKSFGGGVNLVGKFEAYQIKTWDRPEITVADSAYPSPCERDTLRVNRQEKSVTLISIPAYEIRHCKDLLGKPQTVNIHLVDGSRISGPRNDKRQARPSLPAEVRRHGVVRSFIRPESKSVVP